MIPSRVVAMFFIECVGAAVSLCVRVCVCVFESGFNKGKNFNSSIKTSPL